jgi:hypothetical protein
MNIIYMKSQSDWFVMNMVKKHINQLKKLPANNDNVEAILRNEAALRSFHEDIRNRSAA